MLQNGTIRPESARLRQMLPIPANPRHPCGSTLTAEESRLFVWTIDHHVHHGEIFLLKRSEKKNDLGAFASAVQSMDVLAQSHLP
jgi:hypothetical protein